MSPARTVFLLLLLSAGCSSTTPARLALDLTQVPAVNADGTVNVVVEIPAGTSAKWEATKDGRAIAWERVSPDSLRVIDYLAYPANYGIVPNTLLPEVEGGDGDPLDAVLLGTAVERGTVVPARAIGVLRLRDRGEQDDKILFVPLAGPFSSLRTLDELRAAYPGVTEIIETWFTRYKGAGIVVSDGFAGTEAADALIGRFSARE